jgi:hypothetical protein
VSLLMVAAYAGFSAAGSVHHRLRQAGRDKQADQVRKNDASTRPPPASKSTSRQQLTTEGGRGLFQTEVGRCSLFYLSPAQERHETERERETRNIARAKRSKPPRVTATTSGALVATSRNPKPAAAAAAGRAAALRRGRRALRAPGFKSQIPMPKTKTCAMEPVACRGRVI